MVRTYDILTINNSRCAMNEGLVSDLENIEYLDMRIPIHESSTES